MIRYVSIFFLFALSIFFFTAARAAPVFGGDEAVFTVSTTQQGLIPGGRGTMSVPAEAEPIVAAYRKHLADSCKELGGKIDFDADFVTAVDVNGDGRADLFMTSQRGFCDGAASYYSGSAGYGSRWAISKADGSYAVSDGTFHRAELSETLRNGWQVILHLHGLSCGKGGAEQCRHVVKFDTRGELVSIAWPDGRDQGREGPKPRSVVQAAASLQGEVIDHHAMHDGTAFDHNRSVMRVYPHAGVIAYDEPKPAVRDVVRSGTVLFRGLKFTEGGRIEGTAFAFKKGCPPAPYAVTGGYSRDNSTITLRGAGPIRQGCEVVGYSEKSPHAILRFKSMMSADSYGDI